MTVNNAVFNEQLWVPVYYPSLATRAVVGVWKRNRGPYNHMPLGHFYFDITKVSKHAGGVF